jgi:hypothetical protein
MQKHYVVLSQRWTSETLKEAVRLLKQGDIGVKTGV